MEKLAKIIRIITVAPIMALMLCTILLLNNPQNYNGLWMFFVCIICLCIVPSLAYPIEKKWHIIGRENTLDERAATRKLAIIMSVIGYCLLLILVVLTHQPTVLVMMAITYALSGLFIFVFSVIIHVNPSGHACGFMGPVIFLCYNISWWFALLTPMLLIVSWSSLKLKRHTWAQLILGTIIPIISFFVSVLIVA